MLIWEGSGQMDLGKLPRDILKLVFCFHCILES